MKCINCGSELKLRTKNSGDKIGFKYWVCVKWPECSYKKEYEGNEQIKPKKRIEEKNANEFRTGNKKIHFIDKEYPYSSAAMIGTIAIIFIFLIAATMQMDSSRSKNIKMAEERETKNETIKEYQQQQQQQQIVQRQQQLQQQMIQQQQIIQLPVNNEKETALTVHNNNRAYVPVTIGYQGKMITVPLLIDTGATGITITPQIAQRLGIQTEGATQGITTVADGRRIAHYAIDAAFVAVGPKVKKPIKVHVLPNASNEENGLLGMSFLADFPHMIDMKGQTIKWM